MTDVSDTSATPLHADLTPAALHVRFAEAFRPRPWIYWLDTAFSLWISDRGDAYRHYSSARRIEEGPS